MVQVSAGCGHSGFITERGHAYTFGDNRYNQLGEACVKYDCYVLFRAYQATNYTVLQGPGQAFNITSNILAKVGIYIYRVKPVYKCHVATCISRSPL